MFKSAFQVTLSERVTALIENYWLWACNKKACLETIKDILLLKQPDASSCSRDVSWLAEDQTKEKINAGTCTLTVMGLNEC